MAESSLFAGEREGGRIFQIGRLGFEQGTKDITLADGSGGNAYTGTLRTERIAPAGVGALVNFRRISIHLLASAAYRMTVKVWVDDERAVTGNTSPQTTVITGNAGALKELTESVKIEGNGSHIQVEITVLSTDITGTFLIESVKGHGRAIRSTSGRTGAA